MSTDKVQKPLISVVVPVFEEEQMVPIFVNRITPILNAIGPNEIIFCVDPGHDQTVEVIKQMIFANKNIGMLIFSRRIGQPSATMAGIRYCNGETCVVIDVDLQDPPELIPKMYQLYKEGFDVVYAKRISRKGETLLKKIISWAGYRLINAISEVEIPVNTGDFRLVGRRVINILNELKESHGFLRGLVAFAGFKQTEILYDRHERFSGKRKYNKYTGSIKIGFNGIFAYSSKPLTWSLWSGTVVAFIGFFWAILMTILRFFYGLDYPLGIPALIFLGGIQLMSLGLIGEYIGRIYEEVKNRPKYIVDQAINVFNYSERNNPRKMDG